ncbi:hypothetical protein [Nocardioides psychrotolerans]|uniref:hypothetical protein n=1 Tax=Nocardioides psychrotolerans TaxID=1005945 RepID=UPI003137F1A7
MSDPTQPPVTPQQPGQQPGQQPAPATQMVPQQQPGQQQPPAYPQQGYPPQPGYAAPQQGYAPPQPGYAPPQPGYPPQQGYPPQPGQAYAGGPPPAAPWQQTGPPAGSNHSSSKGKTIGLIVAGVVAVGAIGGIGALVLGGGDDERPSSAEVTPGGNGSGILDPEPVGSAPPQPDGSTSPEPTPTEPAPTEPAPTEPPPAPPAPSGNGVVIGSNGVQVIVPPDWQIDAQGADDIGLSNGQNSWVYGLTGVEDPSVEAGNVLQANLSYFTGGDSYTQLETYDTVPQQAYGAIVSLASIDYQALWVDSQSTFPLYGKIFAAVRQDGAVLMIAIEHTPPEEFDASIPAWSPILQGSLDTFAGVG